MRPTGIVAQIYYVWAPSASAVIHHASCTRPFESDLCLPPSLNAELGVALLVPPNGASPLLPLPLPVAAAAAPLLLGVAVVLLLVAHPAAVPPRREPPLLRHHLRLLLGAPLVPEVAIIDS